MAEASIGTGGGELGCVEARSGGPRGRLLIVSLVSRVYADLGAMRVAASAKVRRVLTTSLIPAVTRIPTGRAGALLWPIRHERGTPRRAPAGNRRPAGRKAAGTRY